MMVPRKAKEARANGGVAATAVLTALAHPVPLVATPSPFFGNCDRRCVADLQVCWRLEAELSLLFL